MPSSRPIERWRDIAANIQLIFDYTKGMDEASFLADSKTRDAVERCFLRMSEAARKLGSLAEAMAPKHDWAGLRAIGNILRHAYDDVDPRILWRIRMNELPALLRDAEREAAVGP